MTHTLTVALAVVLSAPTLLMARAAGACDLDRVRFCGANCEHPVRARVAPGRVCAFSWNAGGLVDHFLGNEVIERPKKGILGTSSVHLVAYRADPQASGEDHFRFKVIYRTVGGQTITETIKVQVNIAP